MNWRACDHGDGPEPLPPEELLRSRRTLVEPTRPELREHHIAAAAAEVRRVRAMSSAQALARRSARIVAGVAATLVVTSSLAGAQILVEPARAIFPTVSERLIPYRSADQDPVDYVPADTSPSDLDVPATEDVPTTRPDRSTGAAKAGVSADSVETTATEKPAKPTTSTSTSSTSSSSTSSTSSTSTTDPDSSTTTTEPDSSTTTTEPDSSTTTTEPGSSTTTTTIVAAPSQSTNAPPF